MGFFQTKDPKTGEPRLGAGVYLIICAAMIAGVVLWNVRQHAHEPGFANTSHESSAPANPSTVAEVATQAASHSESPNIDTATNITSPEKSVRGVDLAAPQTQKASQETQAASDKTEDASDNLDAIQNTVELLRQNQEKAEREKADAVAQAKAQAEAESNAKIEAIQKKALTSTAENPEEPGAKMLHANAYNGGGDNRGGGASSGLTVYDCNRDAPKVPVERPLIPTGFDTNNFLPRGYMFPVYILTTIQTVNQEDIIEMGVAENVIFQHKIQIPFGTRLLGSAAAANFEDRVMVNVDTILYPDGKELPISGFLKDPMDLASGVRGYYIPQPFAVQITPYVSEFIDLWTQAAATRFSGINQTYASGTAGSGQVFQGALQQTSDLIQQQAQKIQQRLDRRYPEKVVVPIGTKAYVEVRSPLDFTRARIGGSFDNKQPILPGFQNNPIDPDGRVERSANGALPGSSSPARPVAQPPAISPATANQITQATNQEAQTYATALKQLQDMQSQLNAQGGSGTPSAFAPTSPVSSPPPSVNNAINWPQGDIE